MVGNHGVQNILQRLGLNTAPKRKKFAREAKGLSPEEALRVAKGEAKVEEKALRPVLVSRELNPQQRLDMIERVMKFGEPVAKVCRDYSVSRPTFYKWLKRYQKVAEEEKTEALLNKEPEVERYYRQTPEKYEEAVLSVVAQYPQFGVVRIVQALPKVGGKPIVGHHGVQNILRRQDLNTYEKRLAYAQTELTPVTRLISQFVGLGTRFVSLPVNLRARLIKFAGVTLLSAFTTTVLLGVIGYFITITGAAPAASRAGLLFATISLGVGMIFFTYSMKYYLTLAIVLSFSRQPLEEGGGYALGLNGRVNGNYKNGNGNGSWLQKIFGRANGNGNGKNGVIPGGGLQPSLDHIRLKRKPFVSIHLPFYNEKKVAERILSACTSMDYFESGKAQYEVIVCDDSSDQTKDIVQKYAEKHNRAHPNGPRVKVLHRPNREGFKGGALKYAVQNMNPKTEFCVVFDADFIPYPDTLELFVKYFKATGGWKESASYQAGKIKTMAYDTFNKVVIGSQEKELLKEQEERLRNRSEIACVAGYQWHVLNKSENWITRGVRTEYAGSYVVERPGQEILGAFKIIHGSVYMVRADVLKHFGWGTSITEDFELTLRIYEKGFRVVYTPYVQAPSECVSTIKRLIRQRMRWSEGHSFNIRKMFLKLIANPRLTLMEKLEFLYISPYYLQAFFFLVGTFSWLMAETVFRARLPFWTSLWGWSLVLTNFFSLPLVNAVGLFLEESEEKDYLGLLSFVALSYVMVPFQAYASVKGFIEKREGPWFRTPKTGKITDIFTRGKFYRWIAGILPGRRPTAAPAALNAQRLAPSGLVSSWGNKLTVRSYFLEANLNPYLALATANNQFNNFNIKPKRMRWVSKVVLAILLIVSSTILSLTRGVPEVFADPPSNYYLSATAVDLYSSGGGEEGEAWMQQDNYIGGTNTDASIGDSNTADYWWYSDPYDNLSISGDTWTLNNYISGGSWGGAPSTRWIDWKVDFGYCNDGADADSDECSSATDYVSLCPDTSTGCPGNATAFQYTDSTPTGINSHDITGSAGSPSCSSGNTCRVYLRIYYVATGKANNYFNLGYNGSAADYITNINPPTMTIPEKAVFLVAATPFIPLVVLWMKRRKGALEFLNNT